jgi:hypothetical protein
MSDENASTELEVFGELDIEPEWDPPPLPAETQLGLKLLMDIRLELGRMNYGQSELTKLMRELVEQRKSEYPIRYPSTNSGVASAGNNLAIGLGGPSLGRRWNVRNAVVGGLDPTIEAAGTAFWFKSAADPNAFATESPMLPLSLLKDIAVPEGSTQSFPQVAFYGPRDFEVEPNDKVFCVIIGPSNGVAYTASIEVDDLPAYPVPNMTSV